MSLKEKHILVPFSYVFHPVFVIIYGALIYFFFKVKDFSQSVVLLSIFQITILTCLIPLLFFFLLKLSKKATTFTESTIEERKWPLLVQIALLYCLLKFGLLFEYFPELYLFIKGGLLSAFIALVSVTFSFKCSLHMIGITSLTAFLFFYNLSSNLQILPIILACIICCGFVATSRLFMKSHKPIELIIGSIIGLFSQIFFWDIIPS